MSQLCIDGRLISKLHKRRKMVGQEEANTRQSAVELSSLSCGSKGGHRAQRLQGSTCMGYVEYSDS